jgi:hypothetical protein
MALDLKLLSMWKFQIFSCSTVFKSLNGLFKTSSGRAFYLRVCLPAELFTSESVFRQSFLPPSLPAELAFYLFQQKLFRQKLAGRVPHIQRARAGKTARVSIVAVT